MNTRRLVIFILFISIFIMAARISIDVTDTWWHLATGRLILENRSVPLADPFSHTRFGAPWKGAAANWISQLILYLTYQTFSFGGLNILIASIVTLTFFFIYRIMRGEIFFKAFMLIIAAAASGVYWSARPYMASFLLCAVFLWILEDYRWERKNRLWLLPLLQILWTNSHSGWVYGPIIFAIYALAAGLLWLTQLWDQENKRFVISKDWWQTGMRGHVGRYLIITVFIFLAIAINPSGPSMWVYPFETVSIEVLQDMIAEWQSPDFHTLQVQPLVWMILVMLIAVGTSERRLQLTDFILFTVFAYLALVAVRNIAQFALVAPLVISHYAESGLARLRSITGFKALADTPPTSRFQANFNIGIAIFLALIIPLKIITIYPRAANQDYIDTIAPVTIVEYMQAESVEGKVFNTYNWGGYLSWMAPEYPVFVDGRTDLYRDEIIGIWLNVIGGYEGWDTHLDDFEIDLILIEKFWPLNYHLEDADNGWTLLFETEDGVLYQRAAD